MLAHRRVRSNSSGDPASGDLLAWYDRQRRDLPWRAKLGERPDPYRVWLSEIMLQQTTVAVVRGYYGRFLDRFPTLAALAAAPEAEVMQAWAGLGYYSRARHLHACARRLVEDFGARFPADEGVLRSLPGIGAYTAAAVAAIAFNRAVAAVDGNVERVLSRLYAVDEPLPKAKPVLRALAQALVPADRPGDFAQALMDLGATICTPRRPACALCPWASACRARAAGTQATYPHKAARRNGEGRRGAAFVIRRADGALLLRTRPAKGLLGGMAEVPGTAWSSSFRLVGALAEAPLAAAWQRLPGAVDHGFTHFPLRLAVWIARVPQGTSAPDDCRWTPADRLADEALPSLMRKVIEKALGAPADAAALQSTTGDGAAGQD